MAEKLATMGFQSLMVDPDVWLRAATKVDGKSYYEYVLMYVNDILSISCDPHTILEEMQDTFNSRVERLKHRSFTLAPSSKRS
jgi:hypothetical protein